MLQAILNFPDKINDFLFEFPEITIYTEEKKKKS